MSASCAGRKPATRVCRGLGPWRTRVEPASSDFANQPFDFAVFRKAMQLVLGEDELAVDAHIEDAVLTANELGFDTEFFLERRGQTGRAG